MVYQDEDNHIPFHPTQDSHKHLNYTSGAIEGFNTPNHFNHCVDNENHDVDQAFGSNGGGYCNIDKASGEFNAPDNSANVLDNNFDYRDEFDLSDGVEDGFEDGSCGDFNDVYDDVYDGGGDDNYQEEDFYGYDEDPY
jgi:hypothetical protein